MSARDTVCVAEYDYGSAVVSGKGGDAADEGGVCYTADAVGTWTAGTAAYESPAVWCVADYAAIADY